MRRTKICTFTFHCILLLFHFSTGVMRLTTIAIALLSIFVVSPADGKSVKHSFLRHLEADSSDDNCGRPDDCPEEFCVGDDDSSDELLGRCEPGGGFCSEAVGTFLTLNFDDAVDLLKYGKYCGRLNRCSELEGCEDLPEPCNAIDEACMNHDACLDDAIKNFEAGGTCFDEDSDIDEDRLKCDASFVAALGEIFYDDSDDSDDSDDLPGTAAYPGLCDENYYTSNDIGQVALLLGHEAVLIAAPFCGAIAEKCPGSGIAACEDALPFCGEVLNILCAINELIDGSFPFCGA